MPDPLEPWQRDLLEKLQNVGPDQVVVLMPYQHPMRYPQRAVLNAYADQLGVQHPVPLDREYTAEQLENSPYRELMRDAVVGAPDEQLMELNRIASEKEEAEAARMLANRLMEAWADECPNGYIAMADIAVKVFQDWLRNPPKRMRVEVPDVRRPWW